MGSRRQETARTFGERFGIPHQYGSYQELVDDPDIEAVYIATPASAHNGNIKTCLAAGKAVLCEKPLTFNGHEAEEVISLTRLKQVFLMEAMWTRFVPAMRKLRNLLAQGLIGEVQHFMADIGSSVPFDPHSRVFSRNLGGGALLQKGIYLLSLGSMLLSSPSTAKSMSIIGETDVDEQTGILLSYADRRLATLWCSINVTGQRGGTIMGTTGQLKIHDLIICPSTLTLQRYRTQITHHMPPTPDGEFKLQNRLVQYAKGNRLLRFLRESFPAFSNRVLHGIHTTTFYDPLIGGGFISRFWKLTGVCVRAR